MASPPRNPDNRAAAEWVVDELHRAGHEALLAGGCVRDLLLGHLPTDHDVATNARPDDVLTLFRRTRAVGRHFGVILVGAGDHWIEVATFRSDGDYQDGRRPERVHFSTAREDAERRDFTINAMFLDPRTHAVIDYVGGQADLRARQIRAVGEPGRRFAEDHLRLLRAIRFAARLGFDIEPQTWAALRATAGMLPRVSVERIAMELENMLVHPSRAAAWRLLQDAGLVAHLYPGAQRLLERQAEISNLIDSLPEEAGWPLVLACMALPTVEGAVEVCDRLRQSNDVRSCVEWLVAHHRDLDVAGEPDLAGLKRLMAGPAFTELMALLAARIVTKPGGSAEALHVAIERASAIDPAAVAPPPLLTGDELMKLGAPQGPLIGRILTAVYTAQLNEQIADHAAALEMARRELAKQVAT